MLIAIVPMHENIGWEDQGRPSPTPFLDVFARFGIIAELGNAIANGK